MKININPINFSETSKIFKKGDNTVTHYFNDENILVRAVEIDKSGRDVDAREFDKEGNIISHLHKEYSGDNMEETFKNKFQQYVRKVRFEQKDGFSRRIEEFISETSPKSNYVHEFIKDASGKLLQIISNGKILNLR